MAVNFFITLVPGVVSTTFHFLCTLRIGPISLRYIILGWKGFPRTNTLAYLAVTVSDEARERTLTPGPIVISLFKGEIDNVYDKLECLSKSNCREPTRCFNWVCSGLTRNITLDWKGLPGTNNLSYYEHF
jgi:hypothetical protein